MAPIHSKEFKRAAVSSQMKSVVRVFEAELLG